MRRLLRLGSFDLAAAVVAAAAVRTVAASDVRVAVDTTTGEARITGSASDDGVAITWGGVEGAFTIAGTSGTTIDGAASLDVNGVRSFLFEMGAGDDSVRIDDATIPRDLRVTLDDGDDTLELVGVRVHGRTKVFGGPGADSVVARDGSNFRNSLAVKSGGGDDTIVVRNSAFRHFVRLLAGPGDDRMTLDGDDLFGGGDLGVLAHSGKDLLAITDCTLRQPLRVSMGPGRDEVRLTDTDFEDAVLILGGAGRDALWFGGGLTWSLSQPPEFREFP